MRLRPHLTYANVMATIAVFAALGGGAVAATSFIGSDGAIHGCVTAKGKLMLVRPGKRCAKGSRAIAWNEIGPKGEAGAKGDPGAKGDTGATGPKGDTGATGTVDTSNFFTKSQSDARYVQGNAQVLSNHLLQPNAPTTTNNLFDIAGAGRLISECSELTAPERAKLRLIYHNLSSATQVVVWQYRDTLSSPTDFMASQTVAAGADVATPYTLITQNQDTPFRLFIAVQPDNGAGTHLTFEVGGALIVNGNYNCAPHGVAFVEPA
jgi:hypothetical protein